ncbi:hypothetical protein AUR04nite_20710 [Glutamicibacter uratoxydans]|uniref:Uncharacterized protein n=1 Tax=Glutamicibacter uratoxydans TaxID=43667 RepID=A0A4Y4DMH3_GLUUR|nr:hypothetical protein [Glutamicibacter uratoxydans]GED06539.1 hypothetical protein AUR04nite_20710 [Glutamicibacter uratoxydans]
MEQTQIWPAVLAAVLGSTVLNTLLNSIIGRFSIDRDQQHFQSLKNELDILESLTRDTDAAESAELDAGRTVLREVVKARHYQKNVEALIPKRSVNSFSLKSVLVVFILAGFVLIAAGDSINDPGTAGLGWFLLPFGLLAMAVVLCDEHARSHFRAMLMEAIQGKHYEEKIALKDPSEPWHSKKFCRLGWMPELDIRQTFDLLMEKIIEKNLTETARREAHCKGNEPTEQ